MKHPQEIEVWYVLPAIRRELAKELIETHRFTQKKVAKILGITEAAVSQYVKGKRAFDLVFSGEIRVEIKKSAERIAKEKSSVFSETQRICSLIWKTEAICDIHKKYDEVPEGCQECRAEDRLGSQSQES